MLNLSPSRSMFSLQSRKLGPSVLAKRQKYNYEHYKAKKRNGNDSEGGKEIRLTQYMTSLMLLSIMLARSRRNAAHCAP